MPLTGATNFGLAGAAGAAGGWRRLGGIANGLHRTMTNATANHARLIELLLMP